MIGRAPAFDFLQKLNDVIDRACTGANPNANRADRSACGAGPEDRACGRKAAARGRCKSV